MKRRMGCTTKFALSIPIVIVGAWLLFNWIADREMTRGHEKLIPSGLAFDATSTDARMGLLPDNVNGALVIDAIVAASDVDTIDLKLISAADLHIFDADTQRALRPEVGSKEQSSKSVEALVAGSVIQDIAERARTIFFFDDINQATPWRNVDEVLLAHQALLSALTQLDLVAVDGIAQGRRASPYHGKSSAHEHFSVVSARWNIEVALSQLLAISATSAMESCDSREALLRLQRLEHFGNVTGSSALSILDTRISMGIKSLVADRLIEFAPYLDWSDPIVRDSAMYWMDVLSEDNRDRDHLINGIAGETAYLQMMLAHDDVTKAGLLFRPLNRHGAASLASYTIETVELLAATENTSVFLDALPSLPSGWTNVIARGIGHKYQREVERFLRMQTERRVAMVAIAASLYRSEHDAWPSAIDVLLPDYLAIVPTDGLTGTAIAYSPGDSIDPRPRFWTVGPDGEDDGGRAPADDEDRDADNVRYLDQGPPPARTW